MRPNTDLTIIVTDAAGATATFDSNARIVGNVPRNVTFATQQASGFHTASFTLACPIDRERPDVHLRDDVRIIGASGDTAYEGFIVEMPRSTDMDGEGTLTINCAGYMADTSRASFTEVFVDRDLSQWGAASRTEQIADLAAGYADRGSSVLSDQAAPALRLVFLGPWGAGGLALSQALYDAGPGNLIGSIYYEWTKGANVNWPADPNWVWFVEAMTGDNLASGQDTTANLASVGPGSGTLTTTTARRFAMIRFYYSIPAATPAGMEYSIDWRHLAVRGNHGLPAVGATAPYGVAASDVIRFLVGAHCPKLNTDGVDDTTFPIDHLVFKDRTKVYDALLKVNSFHLWSLAVYEDRTLYFKQIDLSDWDWEVRHDVRGTSIGLQGDSVETLRNGIIVQYPDVATQRTEELHPDDHPELLDDSIDNPFNMHGDEAYGDPYVIPFPTTADNALELGRIKLMEDLQVKAPGSFTITSSILDRAGVEQPAWKVRAGDRVRLTSTANLSDRPRLVAETGYAHDSRTVTISVDSTSGMIDALMDRTTTALQAAGLG